jgi:antitoxin component YwqK of YwqJK toxin-antitoxin module
MIIRAILAPLLIFAPLVMQDDGITKHVVRKHDNGKPYVVIFTKGPENVKVKEQLYFENGQLDYEGEYKRGQEHGDWTYYWPNGNLKSEEFYERGLEEGTMYDYNEDGAKIKEYKYLKGRLIKETKLVP